MRKNDIDGKIFWPTLIILIAVSAYMVLDAKTATTAVNALLNFTTYKFGWLFLLVTVGSFIFLSYLAFSKFGSIKLGDPEDQPEFSTFSWVAMLFCAGIGAGILYWGTIEWAYFANHPPMGVLPNTADALTWATSYNLFHWGLSAWGLYTIPTIPIAYSFYIRKRKVVRMSEACRPVLGKYTDGIFGTIIDVLVLFGLIGGMSAALGMGTPMVAESIHYLTGIPTSFNLNLAIVVLWTLIFGTSVYLGLEKGIKILSDINVYLILALLGFILLVGPRVFIVDTFINGFGNMMQNFIRMSTWTDPFSGSGFPQNWTIFYWAWWLAIGPFMGLWVTRISKGRTIKQVILGEVIFGSVGTWMFHGVLGNFAVYQDINGIVPVRELLATSGGNAAVVATITSLPLGSIALAVFALVALVNMATALDSSAYSIAMVCTKDMSGISQDPARWHRSLWAAGLALLPISLMFLGGLAPLQTAATVTGLPLVFVFIIMCMAVWKSISKDFGDMDERTIKKGMYKISGTGEIESSK